MACTINFLDDVFIDASAGGTLTYNGAILIEGSANPYDGDESNTAQFTASVDVITSPPGELPAPGNPVVGATLNPSNHTPAYYSFTYEVTSGSCTATSNQVIPLVAEAYAGQNVVVPVQCTTPTLTLNLFNLISQNGVLDVNTGGTWSQISGTPSPHPGFTQLGDETTAEFDMSTINYPSDLMPLGFLYTTSVELPAGYTVFPGDCSNCQDDSAVVLISVSDKTGVCCPDPDKCYTGVVADGTTIWTIALTDGSFQTNTTPTNPNLYFTFGYTLPAENQDFEDALNAWLSNNGGGTATITPTGGGANTIVINNPCVGIDYLCHDEGCVGQTAMTGVTCI